MSYNWQGPASIPGFAPMFQAGMEMGRQNVERARREAALGRLAADPTNQQNINALLPIDPALYGQFQQAAVQRRQMEQQEAQQRARRGAGALYASGDTRGARNQALQSGDLDLAQQFMSLDENAQKQVAAKYAAAAPVLMRAKAVPYEQRRALIASAAPVLTAQGWTQEEINSFDPTDEAIAGLSSAVMTVDQILAEGKVNWVTIPGVGAFATDSQGRPTAPGGAGTGSPLDTPTPAAPAAPPAAGAVAPGQSYRDPAYGQVEARLEQQYGLPAGIMNAIRTKGERSNADQVSEAGARSVYQVIPATRAAFMRKYGVDAYASPEAAAQVAALHLKESYERTGDWNRAVTEYHGGPDPRNWGPRTRAYSERVGPVGGGQPSTAQADPNDIQRQAASGVVRAPQQAPAGYRFRRDGSLEPIPGGPGEQSNRKERNDLDQQTYQRVTQLRQEFNSLPVVREWNTARIATKQIQRLATQVGPNEPGRAQADMAMVFTFMKVLDPNSTVREGEYATAQNAAGIPERIRNQYNRAKDGSFLSPEQRRGMLRAAQDVYRERATVYNEYAQQYRQYFSQLGVDPRQYVPVATPDRGAPLTYPNRSNGGTPRPGEVRRGYRFKGGNPADRNSWEKVR